MRTLLILIALTGFVPLIGCGEEGVSSDMAEVSGKVTHGGSPVAGAAVTFKATTGTKSAFGRTNEEGVYTLTMGGPTPGVEPGEYVVTVTKTETTGGTVVSEDDPAYDGAASAQEATVKQLLPAKYGNANSTPLKATLTKGKNDVPLELED